MRVSIDAILRTLQMIVDQCDNPETATISYTSDPHNCGDLWMTVNNIAALSGYSREYAWEIIKVLYWDKKALQRTKKGTRFYYRPTAQAEKTIKQLEKAKAK